MLTASILPPNVNRIVNEYPRIFRVRQKFNCDAIADIPSVVEEQLISLRLSDRIKSGESVAITAGSRGIRNIATVITSIVQHVTNLNAIPFIVPAMGSHGGGTVKGQLEVLESYGITEANCGCEIRAGMETKIVCQANEGFPVHFDRHAADADHVIVCNRIKPHTDFTGDIQSGLMKMMLIGLGKHEGAKIYHKAIQDHSFGQIVRSVAGEVVKRCRIAGGIAIVENALDETEIIQAVLPEEFESHEKRLLQTAIGKMAQLPFDEAHVLLVDQIGKNISGTGMDTNVVGRKYTDHAAVEGETPQIKRIVIRGLTPETHGNGCGIGMCEFARTAAVEQVDFHKTAMNCITSNHVTAGMIPLHYPTDREILDQALVTIGLTKPIDAKLMWIRNTLDLEYLECSEAYFPVAQKRNDLEVMTEPCELNFDASGNLVVPQSGDNGAS